MPSPSLGISYGSTLCLICPMDCMEQIILRHVEGEVFFYTALGVYFEFGHAEQRRLGELISKHDINQIAFISSIDSTFYKSALCWQVQHRYPVEKSLAQARREISNHPKRQPAFSSNICLLAAEHLTEQKKRLRTSHFLGNRIKQEDIGVEAYVYLTQFFVQNKKRQQDPSRIQRILYDGFGCI